MSRPRVYRDDIRCPDCGSNWMRKDGLNGDKQRYRCGVCRRRYVPGGAYRRPGPAVKEQAMAMYTDGSSLSAISRVVGVSVQAVSNWVKKGGARP